ncbi:extracellular solute-binding protein [Paenibacillus periandrae]|uniref:extracellular solute-binding protein n=1 Tax=Paenibacillus periandrae TaxID=1761741 RepID=UPI001F09BADE|nr:extracellular solute-binding protein [Paenibacillus periandrae]
MKRKRTTLTAATVSIALLGTMVAGCSSNQDAKQGASSNASSNASNNPYVELWTVNDQGNKNYEKDGPTSKKMLQDIGVGIYNPLVVWDGGNNYSQKLQTRIASGDIPDLFVPWKGIESDLAKQGALADLTDLLPKYAPHVYNRIPEDVWKNVKKSDPTGKGRIYFVPKVTLSNDYGGFIRKDWLDKLGLSIPQTQDEYVNVLRAFRDKDPNGNGQKDELPLSGREQGRWFDNLFGMYGVAMLEGYPQWDLYNGEITYSAITPNMKASLTFLNKLYAEKLLDNNTFLNKSNDWWARITSEKVGTWFHLGHGLPSTTFGPISQKNPKLDIAAVPLIKVDGYQGYITNTRINSPAWVIANKSEATTINALKVIDWINDPAHLKETNFGMKDVNYKEENGKIIPLNSEKSTVEAILFPTITDWEGEKILHELTMNSLNDDQKWMEEMKYKALTDIQSQAKTIAGDGLPASVYDGFTDIKNHTLYQEYMAKIIIGEWPIDKFDEFVEKWKKTGGDEVTKRVKEWYKQIKQ